jgi:hypothetical protein
MTTCWILPLDFARAMALANGWPGFAAGSAAEVEMPLPFPPHDARKNAIAATESARSEKPKHRIMRSP